MKTIILILFTLLVCRVQAADTIYVKKVYVGRWKTRVKAGYIIRLTDSTYKVNDLILKLREYKPTNRKNFKSQIKPNNHGF